MAGEDSDGDDSDPGEGQRIEAVSFLGTSMETLRKPAWGSGASVEVLHWNPLDRRHGKPVSPMDRTPRRRFSDRADEIAAAEAGELAGAQPEPVTIQDAEAAPEAADGAPLPDSTPPMETEPAEPSGPSAAASSSGMPAEGSIPEGFTQEEVDAQLDEMVQLLRAPYREGGEKLGQAVDDLCQRVHEDVVELAVRIAEAIVRRHVEIDRSFVLEQARRALRLTGPVGRLVVRCAALDAPLLRESLPELAPSETGRPVEVFVRPSDDIAPGGVLLTFEGGIVDGRMEKALERLGEAVKAAMRDRSDCTDEPTGDASDAADPVSLPDPVSSPEPASAPEPALAADP